MSLESIKLINFQCHQKQLIEFDPISTVLVGKTDAGKSAFLRALRWVCQNFPAGQEFIRDGAETCQVILKADGHKILRKVGKSNDYRLDGKKFKAFGRSVPPEIAKLLNVRDENFQEQLDGPFWLALTPGQVGKELNAIINLGVIDEVLASLNAETRRTTQAVSLTKERLQEAKTKKSSLAWVPAMAEKLANLQAMQQAAAVKAQNKARLTVTLQQASQGQSRLKRLRQGLNLGLPAVTAGKQVLAKQEEGRLLRELVVELKTRKADLCELRKRLEKAQAKFKKATTGQQCPICQGVLS